MSTTGMTRLVPILAITFVDVLGFTLLIPILPYYAEHYGASPFVVGSIVTTVAAFGLLASPVWGRVSDRIGRKRVLVFSQLIATLSYVMLAIGGSLAMIFVARAIEGIGGANIGVTQSYVTDLTEPKDRARAFALVGAAFGTGFVFGPAVGGLLVHFGYAVPFIAAAAMQLLTVALTITILPESHRPIEHPPTLADIGRTLVVPRLRSLLTQNLFFALSFTMWVTVFALYVERVLGFGPSQTSLLYVVPGVIGVLVQIFLIGRLVDRLGERRVAIAGLWFGVIGMAWVAFINDLQSFFATLILWSFAGALVRPSLGALISQAAPADRRGTVLGANDSINAFAFIIGPLISTTILGRNVHLVGILPAACALIAIIIGVLTPQAPATGDEVRAPAVA